MYFVWSAKVRNSFSCTLLYREYLRKIITCLYRGVSVLYCRRLRNEAAARYCRGLRNEVSPKGANTKLVVCRSCVRPLRGRFIGCGAKVRRLRSLCSLHPRLSTFAPFGDACWSEDYGGGMEGGRQSAVRRLRSLCSLYPRLSTFAAFGDGCCRDGSICPFARLCRLLCKNSSREASSLLASSR